jgi:sigma-B regulation protein RsbU (phosphoserine phosphatase)
LRSRNLSRELQDKIGELDRTLRRHERLTQQHERIREELSLARRVQQALLPALPEDGPIRFAATYRPALEVGGDLYDVVTLEGGRLAAFVADTTGHGVQAALNTTLLKSALARFHGGSAGPADMLVEMNRMLHDALPSDVFVAATLATIDPDAATVCVAGAGGPHPLRLRDGGHVERIASNGLPLGAVDPSTYQSGDEVTVELEPGDRIVLYTDGLTEVEDEAGDEFGDGGLMGALEEVHGDGAGLDDLGERLLERAGAFAREEHEWDDVTVFAIEMGQ